MAFKNQLAFTKNINRQYSDQFAVSGAKIGDTITIRKPSRFIVSSGPALQVQNVVDESTALVLNQQKHVDSIFTTKDLTLSIDAFRERYIDNQILALANQVDIDMLTMAANSTYNSVGTPGSTPSTLLTYLQAGQKLNEFAAPKKDRFQYVSPAGEVVIVDALKGLFQSSTQIAEQYEEGMMGRTAGATWYMAQNIISRTVGPLGGTPLVNGASQTGASLVTDGWTAAAAARLKAGDVFTLAGVFAVNPITKLSTGSLQQFLVTADVSSDGSGNLTVTISPSIITSGPTQTVTGSPADNAALTVVGAASTVTPQNILCQKNAFTLGTADLEMPGGVHFAARATDPESNLSLRIVRQYDINSDTIPCRIDILYGSAALRPEWSCRVQG